MRKTRVSEKLGIAYPIVQGPFGGGISSVSLTSAVSNAGGLGSFGAHHLSPEMIEETVREIRAKTSKPFSMNLWVPLPGETQRKLGIDELAKSNQRMSAYYAELGVTPPTSTELSFPNYDRQIEALFRAKPPAMSFIFGLPTKEIIRECQKLKIVTLGTATHVNEAAALEAVGVDIVVASGSEAGGHRSSFMNHPLEAPALSALIPQCRDEVKIPLVAAGGIADGRGVVSAFVLGAEGVQVGTAFVACEESNASAVYREALRSPLARYTRLTRVFSGRYARGVRNRFLTEMEKFESDIPPYPLQNALTQPIRQAAGKTGKADFLSIWSGQNAALIRHTRAAEVMKFLVEDSERVWSTLR